MAIDTQSIWDLYKAFDELREAAQNAVATAMVLDMAIHKVEAAEEAFDERKLDQDVQAPESD